MPLNSNEERKILRIPFNIRLLLQSTVVTIGLCATCFNIKDTAFNPESVLMVAI
jgi:hypothetical protein